MIKRKQSKNERLCRACRQVITDYVEGVPSEYHLDCFIEYLVRLRRKHGKVCYTCAKYVPRVAEGGKGDCLARRKNATASRVGCAAYKDKLEQLYKIKEQRTGHRWSALLQATSQPKRKKRGRRRK